MAASFASRWAVALNFAAAQRDDPNAGRAAAVRRTPKVSIALAIPAIGIATQSSASIEENIDRAPAMQASLATAPLFAATAWHRSTRLA
jgi:hypothetical protein